MKRALVTGAGGFIGSHVLAHLLAETDWHVIATDSFRHKGKTDRISQVLSEAPEGTRERLTVVTHDLTVPVSDQMAARIGPVDYVLALASESHVDRSIADPAPFFRNNTEIAVTTLEYARQARPQAVILMSTDEVYGPVVPGYAHPEWAPILPSSPYSASKAAQEAIAISYWRTYGVPVAIVNVMNVIGQMQDPEKYVPMLTARISRGETVTVHGVPGDIGSRHYLHARNLADALLFILRELPPATLATAPRPDRYNIASPDRVDNLELAQMVAGILGVPLDYRLEDYHSTRPGHDQHYGLDPAKFTALGWKPPLPFAESLEATVRWSVAHPEWLA